MFPIKLGVSGDYTESSVVQLPEATTIPTPTSGTWTIYPKMDGWYIKNSVGTEFRLSTAEEGNVPVAPPSGTANRQQFFKGKLGLAGLNSGSTEQAVDGSVSPQVFYIAADPSYDIYITKAIFVVLNGLINTNKFGNITANNINNGWDFKLTEDSNISYIAQGIKSHGEAMLSAANEDLFGDSSSLNEIPNFSANNDAQIVVFNFASAIPNGLRIGRGNTDRLESIVNDNLSGIDNFYIEVQGFKNIPIT